MSFRANFEGAASICSGTLQDSGFFFSHLPVPSAPHKAFEA